MSRTTHTDSAIIEHHEDGTWTETTVVTHTPASRGQKAAAWTGLGVIAIAPFAPIALLYAQEKLEKRREARKAKKNPPLESVD